MRLSGNDIAFEEASKKMEAARKFAHLIIFGAIALLVLLLVYEVIDYKARIGGLTEILYYFGLPVLGLLLLGVSLRLPDMHKINLALGRTDIHSERPIWPNFPRLCVAFFARCAASRFKKRLDP